MGVDRRRPLGPSVPRSAVLGGEGGSAGRTTPSRHQVVRAPPSGRPLARASGRRTSRYAQRHAPRCGSPPRSRPIRFYLVIGAVPPLRSDGADVPPRDSLRCRLIGSFRRSSDCLVLAFAVATICSRLDHRAAADAALAYLRPAARDEHRVLVRAVLPGEVPHVDDVELVSGSRSWELGVDRRHRRVSRAGDDLHRRLDLRQEIAQDRRDFGRGGCARSASTRRSGRPRRTRGSPGGRRRGARTARCRSGRRPRSGGGQRCGTPPDRGPRPSPSAPHPARAERPRPRSRRRCFASGPDVRPRRRARPTCRCRGRRRAAPGACRSAETGDPNDELAHRARREQLIASLGTTEPRQVDRHQVRLLGESRPGRLEREQALRPGAQQEGVIVPVALGEADRQPVDGPEPGPDGSVRPCGHAVAPKCRWPHSLAQCHSRRPRSHPPVHSGSGQSWPGGADGTATGGRRPDWRPTASHWRMRARRAALTLNGRHLGRPRRTDT